MLYYEYNLYIISWQRRHGEHFNNNSSKIKYITEKKKVHITVILRIPQGKF